MKDFEYENSQYDEDIEDLDLSKEETAVEAFRTAAEKKESGQRSYTRAKSKKHKKLKQIMSMIQLICILFAVALIAALTAFAIVEFKGKKAEKETMSTSVVSYSQEELDAALEEARLLYEEETNELILKKQQEILSTIQVSLEEGNTFVETLRPLYPESIVLVSDGKFNFVPISDSLKHNGLELDNLKVLENGELQYIENDQIVTYKGIDVSKFQGKINWDEVKNDGVDFVFIRAALRGYGSGKLVEDECFEDNIKGANAASIKAGVYFFSQAITEEEVIEEAEYILEMIAPYQIDCPIVFDVEKIANDDGRMNNLTVEERTKLTKLFCDTIKAAGYKPMIYHNMEMSVLMLNLEELEEYDKWFAYYKPDFYYPYAYDVWQYTEKGSVAGIKGNVDLNISFKPLWE